MYVSLVCKQIRQKIVLLRKNESSLEEKEIVLKKYFFSSKSSFSKKKGLIQKILIQNAAIKCYHEFHVRSHKNL